MLDNWSEYKSEFEGADLFTGNGFSIGFSGLFSYNSLFQKFLDNVTNDEIYKSFGVSNFELIMKRLKIASIVDKKFDIDASIIDEHYDEIKEGLVRVVIQNHPKYTDLNTDLIRMYARIMGNQFGDIYTTNYDNILYHIILKSNDLYSENLVPKKYSDYFFEPVNSNWLEFSGYQTHDVNKIFYLHGALFIYQPRSGSAYKIRKHQTESDLLDHVVEQVRNDLIPVFVSEGESGEKLRSINTNGYLSFCYSHLRESESEKMFFHGFSFSEQDQHIIDAIKKNRSNRYGVSIYRGNKNEDEIEAEINRIKSKLPGTRISFFDSEDIFSYNL